MILKLSSISMSMLILLPFLLGSLTCHQLADGEHVGFTNNYPIPGLRKGALIRANDANPTPAPAPSPTTPTPRPSPFTPSPSIPPSSTPTPTPAPPPPPPRPKLPQSEVDALSAVAWRLGLSPIPYIYTYSCSWNPSRTSSLYISCNCSYDANTTCHLTSLSITNVDLSQGRIHENIYQLFYLETIDLSGNKLKGSIPDTMGHLSRLEVLDLRENQLRGRIPPTLGLLGSLRYLWLSRNFLSERIPPELGQLSNLETMALQMNRLSGEIPKELGELTKLTEMRLNGNNLSGTLRPELGKLKNLTSFDVSSNNLEGKLPDEFESLTSLYYFSAAANKLQGPIPAFIPKKWTVLKVLYLLGNEFEGALDPEFFKMSRIEYMFISDLKNTGFEFPPVANMKSLYHLILRNCGITGPIPDYIAEWKSLKYLDLSFNNLRGGIPYSFKDMSLYKMILTGNMLSGEAQSWISKIAGSKPDLSYNYLTQSSEEKQELNLKPNRDFLEERKGAKYCQGKPKYDSIFINCGGEPVKDTDGIPYDGDNSTLNFYEEPSKKWMYTCSGMWTWSVTSNSSDYIRNMTCGVSENSIYRTGRLCPVALTYYAFCLPKGNYTVRLHFAETVFTNDEDYSSSGRRLFDVYIQGEKVLPDFDIKAEIGGPNEELPRDLPAIVKEKDNSLEIRLYWPGKGSLYSPNALNGPLLSAISITPSKPKKKLTGLQIAGIVVGSVLSPLLALAFLWQMGFLRDRDLDETKVEVAHGKYVTLRQIIAGTKNFHQTMKIGGEGRFGQVYKSELKGEDIKLAVKAISCKLEKKHKDELQTEISNLASLRHENLVQLLHRHSKKSLHLLIYEYLEKGSLHQALFESETKPNWKERMDICLGIAKGLKYLHEENNLKRVHGNLRPKNIMLDENLTAKLSDFGLAMIYQDDPYMSLQPKEDLVTVAPECAFKPMTCASDVYSFGHVVLEIVSGKPSSERKQDKTEFLSHKACTLHERGTILELVDRDLILISEDKDQAKEMLELAMACLSISPENRPKMSYIASELGRIIRKEKRSFRSKFGGCLV